MGEFMSKQLTGIHGVLGTYMTSRTEEPPSPAAEQVKQPPVKAKKTRTPTVRPNKPARLGRPPGKSNENSRPKEKATLRIDAELMTDYRDWSWEKRCQLGELVERALADYRRRHR